MAEAGLNVESEFAELDGATSARMSREAEAVTQNGQGQHNAAPTTEYQQSVAAGAGGGTAGVGAENQTNMAAAGAYGTTMAGEAEGENATMTAGLAGGQTNQAFARQTGGRSAVEMLTSPSEGDQ